MWSYDHIPTNQSDILYTIVYYISKGLVTWKKAGSGCTDTLPIGSIYMEKYGKISHQDAIVLTKLCNEIEYYKRRCACSRRITVSGRRDNLLETV
jgi:hypothetical protein